MVGNTSRIPVYVNGRRTSRRNIPDVREDIMQKQKEDYINKMMKIYNIRVGTIVKIERSDGRIHQGLIFRVDWDIQMVSVEWHENRDIKAKDFSISALIQLNPHIVRSPEPRPYSRAMKPYNVQQRKSEFHDVDVNKQKHQSLSRNATRQSIAVANSNKNLPRAQTKSRITINANNGLNEQDRRENVPPSAPAPALAPAAIPLLAARPTKPAGTASRKSIVVKKVEKLKKNREERRLRQATEKAEKEAFLQQAPGNPYWEFLNMVQEFQKTLAFNPLTGIDYPVDDHLITVCVRKRPLNKREVTRKEVDVIAIPSRDTVIVHEPKNKVDLTKYLENQYFRFDYAFNETCSNELVYKFTAQPLVKTIFEGGFATCFAYGQTGSGKTHTMGGDFNGKTQNCQKGIYALATKDVFEYLRHPKYKHMNFVVSASFFEIYSGKVFDLLANKAKLRLFEDGKQQVQVIGLTEKVVQNVDEVLKLIQLGNQARTSGQTSANSNSSRSHAIFQICLRTPRIVKVYGKFSLIDLAGNERAADTSSANRQIRMEGAEINKSLLALKECIRALGRKGQGHLPFRASKLTQVLRDSFIGDNSRTCMIAMISPGIASCEHTLNTLRYADRVKELVVENQEKTDIHNVSDDIIEDNFSDDDIKQLQSLNKHDISRELLNFHQAISELQIYVEEVINHHKSVNDYLKVAIELSHVLCNIVNNVECDQDTYCQNWKDLLTQGKNVFTAALNKVNEYRTKLNAEEQMSQKVKL